MKLKAMPVKPKPRRKTNIQIKKQIKGCHIKTNVTASFVNVMVQINMTIELLAPAMDDKMYKSSTRWFVSML